MKRLKMKPIPQPHHLPADRDPLEILVKFQFYSYLFCPVYFASIMDEIFLDKVESIIREHLEDEKFGVRELAFEAGVSRSQLLRKVKAATGQTANDFIREIRLKEAAGLLCETDLTASEKSYRRGFSSPSYFNKCFHKRFGVTPGEFKHSDKDPFSITAIAPAVSNRRMRYLPITVSVLIIISAFFLARNHFDKKDPSDKEYAIAVLPFLDLSDSEDSDYLTEGITEAIILELSRNKSIRVISRGSSMAFKGSELPYEEIAKKLKVNFLLEGSVLFSDDSLRVVAQLIEPLPKESHLWAGNFEHKKENILGLVERISTSIAREINLTVLPQGFDPHSYKIHPEAYTLYLKGRHLYNRATPEALITGIEYLRSSIKMDSNFAPAYATLAESYVLMNKFNQNEDEKRENVIAGKLAVDKALQKGPYLAEAYIAKGNILGKFDWDWEGMREMTEKGLELDPNNSYAHTQLSKYYLYRNNMSKSLDEALIAHRIDPMNARAGRIVAERYFHTRQFDKSLQQFEQVLELHPEDALTYNGLGVLNFVTGRKEEARQNFIRFQQLMQNHTMEDKLISSPIEDGMRFFLERAKKKAPLFCSNPAQIAMVSQFVGEEEQALIYLEAAFAQRDVDLPTMLYGPMFEPLYDEPRFLDIAARTGVNIPIPIAP